MLPNIKTMTIEEKMLTMKTLWDDMRQSVEQSTETNEICTLLSERILRVKAGQAELHDWDEVKGSIGRR